MVVVTDKGVVDTGSVDIIIVDVLNNEADVSGKTDDIVNEVVVNFSAVVVWADVLLTVVKPVVISGSMEEVWLLVDGAFELSILVDVMVVVSDGVNCIEVVNTVVVTDTVEAVVDVTVTELWVVSATKIR